MLIPYSELEVSDLELSEGSTPIMGQQLQQRFSGAAINGKAPNGIQPPGSSIHRVCGRSYGDSGVILGLIWGMTFGIIGGVRESCCLSSIFSCLFSVPHFSRSLGESVTCFRSV